MKKWLIAACCLLNTGIHFSILAQAPDSNPITETTVPKGWLIKTSQSAYQLIIDEKGTVKPVYYGPIQMASLQQDNGQWQLATDEVPVRGGFAGKTPMLEVVFKDGVRDADLEFVKAETIILEQRQVLKLVQKDRYYPLQVETYIRVLPEFDILEKWAVVTNTGKKDNIHIENLQSGNVVLPANQYILSHKGGEWGHEFQPQQTLLTPGIKTLKSDDFLAYANPSWYMIQPEKTFNQQDGDTWYGCLAYSGNYRVDFNLPYSGNLQITTGINFWDSWWNLEPGKSLTTPKMVIGYTSKGAQTASQNLHAYINKTVLPATHRNDMRPVLYNSWYATEFNISEEQQIKIAEIAKETGVELFVIDDGWFKGRVDDKGGLGDWEADKNKFPAGLQPMIKKVNELGMKFGIWVEPEMVNPNSDLYRKHPDWVLYFPNRKQNKFRNQLMLNLAREDVYQYLLKSLDKLLSENNIDFIKWDRNRGLTEPGWPSAPLGMQREVRLRFTDNLYRLIDELKKRHPKVWFESCSGGGGRPDLGILSRMDQVWTSDNTDPIDRTMIQYSYLDLLPAKTMVSWVTWENYHQPITLDFKFDVAMSGVLGIGNDLTKWTEEEKKLAREKISLYKQIRPLVQNGQVFKLISPFLENRSSLQYVAEDKNSAVVFCYQLAEYMRGAKTDRRQSNMLRLQGLDPDKKYSLENAAVDKSTSGQQIYSGDFLMNVGISWPLKTANKSLVILINVVKQ